VPALRSQQARSPTGTGLRVYSEFCDGGFLLYHVPGVRVFQDDRCELYGDRWQLEQVRIVYRWPYKIDELARTAGFRHALVRRDTPLHVFLGASPAWEVIEQGHIATLYRLRE
jgi:hypothetical protein